VLEAHEAEPEAELPAANTGRATAVVSNAALARDSAFFDMSFLNLFID